MKCYTGTKSCGCLTAIICKDCDLEDIEETLEDYKNQGLKIKEMDVEEARKLLKECNHK